MINWVKQGLVLITTTWGIGVVTTCFVMHLLFGWIWMLFFKDRAAAHYHAARPFIWLLLTLNGIRMTCEGKLDVPEGQPFILMSNHESYLDILCVIVAIKPALAFVAKKELFRVPILGWTMMTERHFCLDREDPRQSVRQLKTVAEAIRSGRSAVIFPEGTRSTNGDLLPFKRGAFLLACHTGVPIVPCYIEGSGRLMPKKPFRVRPGRIRVKIGPPVQNVCSEECPSQKERETVLMARVRDAIEALKKEG